MLVRRMLALSLSLTDLCSEKVRHLDQQRAEVGTDTRISGITVSPLPPQVQTTAYHMLTNPSNNPINPRPAIPLIPHQLIASKATVDPGKPPQFTFREDRKAGTTDSWRMWAEARETEEWLHSVGEVFEYGWNERCALGLFLCGSIFKTCVFLSARLWPLPRDTMNFQLGTTPASGMSDSFLVKTISTNLETWSVFVPLPYPVLLF